MGGRGKKAKTPRHGSLSSLGAPRSRPLQTRPRPVNVSSTSTRSSSATMSRTGSRRGTASSGSLDETPSLATLAKEAAAAGRNTSNGNDGNTDEDRENPHRHRHHHHRRRVKRNENDDEDTELSNLPQPEAAPVLAKKRAVERKELWDGKGRPVPAVAQRGFGAASSPSAPRRLLAVRAATSSSSFALPHRRQLLATQAQQHTPTGRWPKRGSGLANTPAVPSATLSLRPSRKRNRDRQQQQATDELGFAALLFLADRLQDYELRQRRGGTRGKPHAAARRSPRRISRGEPEPTEETAEEFEEEDEDFEEVETPFEGEGEEEEEEAEGSYNEEEEDEGEEDEDFVTVVSSSGSSYTDSMEDEEEIDTELSEDDIATEVVSVLTREEAEELGLERELEEYPMMELEEGEESMEEESSEEEEISIFLALPGVPNQPSRPKRLLPKKSRRKAADCCTLVLDLDETLVEARGNEVIVRPHVVSFLYTAKNLGCEVVLWTAGVHQHTQKVIAAIDKVVDPNEQIIWFDHLIYRSPKWYRDNFPSKDLCLLGRPLENIFLIDNNPASASLQPGNSLLVEDYGGAERDETLKAVEVILADVVSALSEASTVADCLASHEAVMCKQMHLPHARGKTFFILKDAANSCLLQSPLGGGSGGGGARPRSPSPPKHTCPGGSGRRARHGSPAIRRATEVRVYGGNQVTGFDVAGF